MFTEYMEDHSDPRNVGTIEINTDYETYKKPVWLILLKLAGLMALSAVGYVLVVPLIPLPFWQAAVVATGVILIYVGIAFFIRPEANTDNMGWLGGMGDDPFKTSDNMNRFLWSAHCCLGPGRFISETILDTFTLLGIMEETHTATQGAAGVEASASSTPQFQQAASLSTDRFAQPPAHEECQGLTTARFLNQD